MRLLSVFVEESLPRQLERSVANIVGTDRADVVDRAAIRLLLTQLSGLDNCHVRFCYRPSDAHDAIRFWLLPEIIDHPDIHLDPEAVDFRPQSDGNLGRRISQAAGDAFREGYTKVAFIGSHCLEISSRWIHATFAQLNAKHMAVLGPSEDGACCLIAMQEYLPSLCRAVSWSSSMESLVQQASRESISLYQLPELPTIGSDSAYQSILSGPMGAKLRSTIEDILESG